MHTDYQNYLNNVTPAINALLAELEKVFPGISTRTYPDPGKYDDPSMLGERMGFALYMEFIRMGIDPSETKS